MANLIVWLEVSHIFLMNAFSLDTLVNTPAQLINLRCLPLSCWTVCLPVFSVAVRSIYSDRFVMVALFCGRYS